MKKTYSIKTKSKTGGTTTVIASTPTPDRYNDVVAGGDEWLTSQYMQNPVVVFGHDYSQPPVGKTEKLTTDADGNLIATIRWDDSPTNPLGQTVAAQFRNGFLSAVSVGFQPSKSTPRNKLPTDHPAYGESGTLFEGNKLLEISAVPVPANGEALAIRAMAEAIKMKSMHTSNLNGINHTAESEIIKSILSIEETEDAYIVTYAKYPDGMLDDDEPADDDDEVIEEGYQDDDDDESLAATLDEDDEELTEALDDDDDDDEAMKALTHSQGIKKVLRAIVQDVIIDLLAEDENARATMIAKSANLQKLPPASDAVASIFGLDK